jgi:peptidoglycan pentaglycine glycine transferase (the first glycine)
MDIRQIGDSEHDLWNGFVADYPSGDLLQSYEWGVVKSRSGDWQPFRLLATDGGKPVAGISILKRKLPRVNKSLFYAPRGPVGDLTSLDVVSALRSATSDLAAEHKAILLKIDPPVPIEDQYSHSNLTAAGFRNVGDETGFGGTQPKCVMQLRLDKDIDMLLAEFKPKARYNIRLAEKKGVTVREGEAPTDLRAFYDLLLETARRDRFLVRGFGYYQTLWEVLAPQGMARLFLAEYESQAVSGALCFYMGDRCWYTYGASSNTHRNVMPNHLMQWHMIQHAKSIGCRIYDFRGVSPKRAPTPGDHLQGLNRFKEGFAAEYVEYIGEYDLPFSSAWYWLWQTAAPKVVSLIKGRKRAESAAAEA